MTKSLYGFNTGDMIHPRARPLSRTGVADRLYLILGFRTQSFGANLVKLLDENGMIYEAPFFMDDWKKVNFS